MSADFGSAAALIKARLFVRSESAKPVVPRVPTNSITHTDGACFQATPISQSGRAGGPPPSRFEIVRLTSGGLLGLRCQTAKVSFRQADLLAKSFQSRIAAKQSQFRETEYRAHPNRPHYGHAIQSLQCAFLIAQTREDHGLLDGLGERSIASFSASSRRPDRA